MRKHVLIAAAICYVSAAVAQDRTVSTLQHENAKFFTESTVNVPGPVQAAVKKGGSRERSSAKK